MGSRGLPFLQELFSKHTCYLNMNLNFGQAVFPSNIAQTLQTLAHKIKA
jgi:hypothetical protein